jgi:trimethylamine monooxygenase
MVLDYLQGWAKKWDTHVTLNRKVVEVTYDTQINKFVVCSEDTKTASRSWDHFDYTIVATGHFSCPHYIPPYPGMENFHGSAIHSHNFRDAKKYAGQKVLIIGNSYSGEDIALQCAKFGAASCMICYRTTPLGYDFGDFPIEEKPVPTHYDPSDHKFVFLDGTRHAFDGVIYCTGYEHSFPFLARELQLHTPSRLVPNTLWKGVLHPFRTGLLFLGMSAQLYSFTAFHAQAAFAVAVIEGRVAVPSDADADAGAGGGSGGGSGAREMLADTAAWQAREDALAEQHSERSDGGGRGGLRAAQHRLQHAHTDEAAALAGVCLRDNTQAFDKWIDDRHRNFLTFRDQV